jgi:hypothetical protein
MQTGTTEVSGLEEAQRPEIDEVETINEAQTEEVPETESARETVARELEKLKNSNGQESEATEQKADSEKQVKPQQEAQKQERIDPDLAAPERLPAGQKAIFDKLPKGLKREANKLFKAYEGSLTQAQQEAAKNRAIQEAIAPYIPEWGMRGVSPAQGIAQLAAAQAKLTNPDKSIRKNSFKLLMRQSGLTAQDLADDGEQVSRTQEASPVISQLQDKIQQLESYIGSQQATNEQAQVKPIIDELESVRQEIDETSGDYRYPELHNEAFLQQTVKPLVSAIKGSVAGISWADALRKAYEISTGRKPAESFQSNQTRLHAAAMKPQTRAIAPVSVRGKSISSASTLDNSEPPPEALMDARATTAWALNQLRTRR